MKRVFLIFPAMLCLAAPAQATTGLVCSTGELPIHLSMTIGHTAVPAVVSARLIDNRREVPVIIAQSWLDPNGVRVDLIDRNGMRHEARLRATWRAATRSYDGSLWRNGKHRWIRCREG